MSSSFWTHFRHLSAPAICFVCVIVFVPGLVFAFAAPADAASLPAPAKVCALIVDRGDKVDKWRRDTAAPHPYYCSYGGHIIPADPSGQVVNDGGGDIWMFEYDAVGSRSRVSRLYFKIEMFDSILRKDQIASPLLHRLAAVFAAADAGAVPDSLVEAISSVTTTSVSTSLGVVRTRFTPGNNAAEPYNSASFEVELDAK